jgi:fructokinase
VLVLVDVNCRPTIVTDRAGTSPPAAGAGRAPTSSRPATRTSRGCDPAFALTAAAEELVGLGARVVLLTTGGAATTIVTAAGAVAVPVAPVAVVDTIGAGDAFTAGSPRGGGGTAAIGTPSTTSPRSRRRSRPPTPSHAVVVGRRGADAATSSHRNWL